MVTAGLMNKQVAGELGVSEITAKMHRGNVMRKMGARSLADLVRMADALGIRQAKHIVPIAPDPQISRPTTPGAMPLRIAGYSAQDFSTPDQGNQSVVRH